MTQTTRMRIVRDSDTSYYIVQQWVLKPGWWNRVWQRGSWLNLRFLDTLEEAEAYIVRVASKPTPIVTYEYKDGVRVETTIHIDHSTLPSAAEVLSNPPQFPELK